ncbi:hypothetical protein DY000_02039060 [Brassica cretica]|uniref:Uncharacterized protein n=1 Tax=Brassica cretica TaxID=69181 RepID=A0ABQ7BPF6_BRACR|nr:hypothetical protein DY000_02039060 [Brassica cretica]
MITIRMYLGKTSGGAGEAVVVAAVAVVMENIAACYGLREIAFEGLTRMHGLMSYRCSEGFNRYTATELRLEPGCYVAARSLRSDRAGRSLGRYVATELWLELGRYVATEL